MKKIRTIWYVTTPMSGWPGLVQLGKLGGSNATEAWKNFLKGHFIKTRQQYQQQCGPAVAKRYLVSIEEA